MRIDQTVAGYIFNEENKLLLVYHKKLGMWLPVGGHIEKNEIPDDALIREAREEVGLDIKILDFSRVICRGSDQIRQLALPFFRNVHDVGDHYHECSFYLCVTDSELNPSNINKEEILHADWFSERALNKGSDFLGGIHYLAFQRYKELKKKDKGYIRKFFSESFKSNSPIEELLRKL